MPSKHDNRIIGPELAAVLPALNKPWFQAPHLLALNAKVMIIILSACSLGFAATMMNGLQSLSTWHEYFGNPSPPLLGGANAVLNLAPIFLGGVVAWVADRFGRRRTIQIGCIIIIFAAILQGTAQNIGMFVAARFFIGAGNTFCTVPAPVLITELAYPTHRPKLTSLFFTFYFVGSILSSWIVFGTFQMGGNSSWSWRIPSLLQCAIPIIQLLSLFFVPESPRWLVGKGRSDDATEVLRFYHAGGAQNSALVDCEMEEIRDHVLADKETAAIGWSKLWEDKADKKRIALVIYIAFMSQLCGNGVVSYYLFLILNSVGISDSYHQTLLNGILQIANWGFAVGGALMVDRAGRRVVWLTSILSMLVAFTTWTALSAVFQDNGSNSKGLAIGVLVMVFYFQLSYSAGINPMNISYPTEILPFKARQKGLGILYICNNVAGIFDTLVTPIAIDRIGWRYYLVYLVLLLKFLIVVYLFFPETKGRSLEQIAELFDGSAFLTGIHRKPAEEQVLHETEKNDSVDEETAVDSNEFPLVTSVHTLVTSPHVETLK